MLGKLISYGRDRTEAIARLQRALREFYANGIKTNAELFQRIVATPDFQAGEIYTRWLDDFLSTPHKQAVTTSENSPLEEGAATIAAALWNISHRLDSADTKSVISQPESRWKLEARREQLRGELEP
jgi:acetyl/propionyl-CoA carboxylase alpha subunit